MTCFVNNTISNRAPFRISSALYSRTTSDVSIVYRTDMIHSQICRPALAADSPPYASQHGHRGSPPPTRDRASKPVFDKSSVGKNQCLLPKCHGTPFLRWPIDLW